MTQQSDIGLPDRLEIFHQGSGIEIVRRWFSWRIIPLTGFAIAWNAMVFGLLLPTALSPRAPLSTTLFEIPFLAVGLGLAYSCLASWCNRTFITASQGRIKVRHSPIPWFGSADLDGSTLKQLYSKGIVTRGRNGSTSSRFEVRANTHDGKNRLLVGGLATSEQALYIEQELERYLHIEDVPVKGQLGD